MFEKCGSKDLLSENMNFEHGPNIDSLKFEHSWVNYSSTSSSNLSHLFEILLFCSPNCRCISIRSLSSEHLIRSYFAGHSIIYPLFFISRLYYSAPYLLSQEVATFYMALTYAFMADHMCLYLFMTNQMQLSMIRHSFIFPVLIKKRTVGKLYLSEEFWY